MLLCLLVTHATNVLEGINNIIQFNHSSLPIEENVSITMQEAMLIEFRVTTNNPPATGQPASQPL